MSGPPRRARRARSGPPGGQVLPGAAPWASDAPGGVLLELLVQPRASRTGAVGEHDGRLKVQLAAPPVDGEANAALCSWLADVLDVRRSDVALVRGEASRRKTVRVAGRSAAEVARILG